MDPCCNGAQTLRTQELRTQDNSALGCGRHFGTGQRWIKPRQGGGCGCACVIMWIRLIIVIISTRWTSVAVHPRYIPGTLILAITNRILNCVNSYVIRSIPGKLPLSDVVHHLIASLASYVTVVEGRPIMSVKYCLSVPVFHFWP